MGKKSRIKARQSAADTTADAGTAAGSAGNPGPRQPCPCGSGRRYKSCHGSASGAAPVYRARPFEGLTSEGDVIALREFVPAATAPLKLIDPAYADRTVLLCSLLPGAAPALVRADGTIWLGLQVQHGYGDPARDLAAVLLAALEAEPETMVGLTEAPGEGPRLQDLVDDAPLEVTVHQGFDYWIADLDDADGSMANALEQANGAASPTARVEGVDSAYWTELGNREYLRWVFTEDEDQVLDGFARLHAAGSDSLVEGDRLIGMFRAHGLAAPVWDLPLGTGAAALAEPAARLRADLLAAMAVTEPLTTAERAARAGLANRQLTVR